MGQISKRRRFHILRRDGFRCTYCGASGEGVTLHVDHVDPKSKGGEDEDGNLVTACSSCNSGKTNIEILNGAARAAPIVAPMRFGLIGKCFVTLGPDGLTQYQGVVRERLTDALYMVQFFSWFDGAPTTMAIIDIGERCFCGTEAQRPGAWIFFEDDEGLRFWLEYGGGRRLTHAGAEKAEKAGKAAE